MIHLVRCLPPRLGILAFEVAAGLGTFTRMAVELDVSQPAVSRQIRSLEDRLGTACFAPPVAASS